MAVMHPADIENYEYTATEREMYEALRDQLPEKYQVFYSIRWFETNEENKRVDSECDFLVFDPSFGFLTIEVKGGLGLEIENGRWFLEERADERRHHRYDGDECARLRHSEGQAGLLPRHARRSKPAA